MDWYNTLWVRVVFDSVVVIKLYCDRVSIHKLIPFYRRYLSQKIELIINFSLAKWTSTIQFSLGKCE
jgi:hypothetical protein